MLSTCVACVRRCVSGLVGHSWWEGLHDLFDGLLVFGAFVRLSSNLIFGVQYILKVSISELLTHVHVYLIPFSSQISCVCSVVWWGWVGVCVVCITQLEDTATQLPFYNKHFGML